MADNYPLLAYATRRFNVRRVMWYTGHSVDEEEVIEPEILGLSLIINLSREK